jgi:hypothetical protein
MKNLRFTGRRIEAVHLFTKDIPSALGLKSMCTKDWFKNVFLILLTVLLRKLRSSYLWSTLSPQCY